MPRTKPSTPEFVIRLDRKPERFKFLQRAQGEFRSLAEFYGFEPIRVSPVEDAYFLRQLAKSGFLGDKPPLVCRTGSGAGLVILPQPILGVLRAYLSYKMNDLPQPLKLFFEGDTVFVESSKTKGQEISSFGELGLCMLGEEGPIAEAEIIQVIWKALQNLGTNMASLNVRINATGCGQCRPLFRSSFVGYLRPRGRRLCKHCKRYLKHSPTRTLVCREETCRITSQNAPQVLDFLCELCKKHLKGVLEFLDEAKISYLLDPRFFRDDSVYSHIVFELSYVASQPKPSSAEEGKPAVVLAEGGRISKVGELVTGKRLDGASGSILVEKLEEALAVRGGLPKDHPRVFLVHLGELAKRKSLGILELLRQGEIPVQESLGRDSVKSQLKIAERVGAEVALIFGQKEALDNTVIVREIQSGIQETIPQEKLVEFLKRKLKK